MSDLQSMNQHGETNSNALLNVDEVLDIQEYARDHKGEHGMQTTLARRYGVTPAAINHIISGKRWPKVRLDDYEKLLGVSGKRFWERRME